MLYINGKLHRKDESAVEYANGDKYWYLNCLLHREDGPAIKLANGHKEWWINGELHREDGPAIERVTERANGKNSGILMGSKSNTIRKLGIIKSEKIELKIL